MKQELFLDLGKYQGRFGSEAVVAEMGKVFRENRDTREWSERISYYDLVFDQDGRPNFAVSMNDEVEVEEVEGMENMRLLALQGYKNVVWISPKGGLKQYPGSRLIVGEVIKRDGEVVIRCRAISCDISTKRCEEISSNLVDLGGKKIRDDGGLRSQPVGAVTARGESIFDLLESLVPEMPKVWQRIKTGGDVGDNLATEAVVRRGIEELGLGRRIMASRQEAIEAGAMFEVWMRRQGYGIEAGGVHGVSNTAALGDGIGSFNYIFNRSEGMRFCPKCGKWYTGAHCGFCGYKEKRD